MKISKKIIAILTIFIIGIIIIIFGLNFTSYFNNNQQNSTKINELKNIITNGKWIKTLGNDSFTETYRYTFYQNHTFLELYASDVFIYSYGNWSLIPDEEDNVHLILNDSNGYWLPNDTIINYNKSNDTLLVSGASIVGIQSLEHERVLE